MLQCPRRCPCHDPIQPLAVGSDLSHDDHSYGVLMAVPLDEQELLLDLPLHLN